MMANENKLQLEITDSEPMDPFMSLEAGRDPSSELQVTYENESAMPHSYSKDTDAISVYIKEDGTVTYLF